MNTGDITIVGALAIGFTLFALIWLPNCDLPVDIRKPGTDTREVRN